MRTLVRAVLRFLDALIPGPPNWEWQVAAGGTAYACLACEDATDGANA